MKLWIGKEREGYHSGLQTLFVADPSVLYDDILAVWKENKFRQIYFGAGMCSEINQEALRLCVINFPEVVITVEVSLTDIHKIQQDLLINPRVEFIVTITNDNSHLLEQIKPANLQIKIQSMGNKKSLRVSCFTSFSKVDVSELKGKMYSGDRVLL